MYPHPLAHLFHSDQAAERPWCVLLQERDKGSSGDVTQLEITTDLALVFTKLPGKLSALINKPEMELLMFLIVP